MSLSLKVLIITSRADFGGGPEHIFQLIKKLKDEIRFYVACPDDYPYRDKYSDLIGADRMMRIPHRKFRIQYLSKSLKFISKNKISIIHSHGKGAGIYSRLISFFSRISVIHTFHGIHLGEYSAIKKSLYILIEKVLAHFTNQFIVVSESEKKKVIDLGITSESKLTLINNGVEIGDQVVDYSSILKKELQVLTITRFDYAKNPDLLIPILEMLKANSRKRIIKIKTVGSGIDEERIKRIVHEKNLSQFITFAGTTNNPMEYLMNSFCYISTSRSEGLPLGVLEAMSVGLPVIATNVLGNRDIVDNNKTGFLFDINKPEQASDCIIKLSEDENLWKKFSVAGRKKIEMNFSLNKMVESTKSLYEHISNQRAI